MAACMCARLIPGIIPHHSPTLLSEFLSVKPSLISLVNLASQLALGTLCLHAWRPEGHHIYLALMWVLGIETLVLQVVEQALSNRAISSALRQGLQSDNVGQQENSVGKGACCANWTIQISSLEPVRWCVHVPLSYMHTNVCTHTLL